MAKCLGIDSSSNTTMWQDKVRLIANEAVLWSFNQSAVTIVDHFSQAEQFMTFFRDEMKTRGGCPSDWVWINPPQSSSMTEVFHQEMLNYQLRPSFDYQANLVGKYKFPQDGRKMKLSTMVKALYFVGRLLSLQKNKRKQVRIDYKVVLY